MTTIPSFTDLLKGAKLPEASFPVCLRADLVAKHEKADRALEAELKKPRGDSLAAGGEKARLRNRITELEQEMTAATYAFTLRALTKAKWRALVAAHPPRKNEKDEPLTEDVTIGVNRETFFDALIRVSVVEPELTPEQWLELLGHSEAEQAALKKAGKEDKIVEGVLTDRQYSDLCDEAWFLNRGEVSVPFSRAALLLNRDTSSE